jgi:hypothetical protein
LSYPKTIGTIETIGTVPEVPNVHLFQSEGD